MKKLLFLLLPLLSFGQTHIPATSTTPENISYTLPSDEAHVSVGIYSGNLLVRTLLSDVSQKAGKQSIPWDGNNDDRIPLTVGTTYTVKVAYNNDVFAWKGTFGNTSLSNTGFNILKGGSQVCAMFFTGTNMRRATGFCEGVCAQSKAPLSSPQQSLTWTKQPKAIGQSTYFGCANSKWMFWGGWDYRRTSSFVFVERLSDENEKEFSMATTYKPRLGRSYSALDINKVDIGGMTVQQGGNMFLYVTHPSTGTIDVSKTADSSGTTHTDTIANTGPITIDTDGFLWIANGTSITKYSINSTTGDLTTTGIQITGFSDIRATHVQRGDLLVLDGGNQDVVKEYNSTSLALIRTIGRTGGYATDPAVYSDKFYENDVRGNYHTFVTHDPSGGVWVGDPGNERSQHFDNKGVFVESVAYIPTYTTQTDGTNNGVSYCVNICGRQNNSVFSDFLEYVIDYKQPIATGATLVRNWGYNLPARWHNTGAITGVYKYPNGRVFAIISKSGGGTTSAKTYLAEFTSTGMNIMNQLAEFCKFDKLGNLTTFFATNTRVGSILPAVLTYQKQVVTVSDSENPSIGPRINVAVIQSGYTDPLPRDRAIPVTASGKIFIFDPSLSTARNSNGSNYYHYKLVDSATATPIARMGVGTTTQYSGDYPTDGTFDIGNQVQYQGGTAEAVGNSILSGNHGEFWKQSEIHIFYKWNDLGLLDGMFGRLGPQVVSGSAPYGFHGNTLATHATIVGGNIYLFCNDENQHFAVGEWQISNTVSEGVISTTFVLDNRKLTVPNYSTDVLANVPNGQVSIQGLSGWSQSQADVYQGGGSKANQFYSITRKNTFNLSQSADVQFYATTGSSGWWQRSITTNPQWTISGQFDLTVNTFIDFENGESRNLYFDVLDGGGKPICRVYFYRTNRLKINSTFFGPYTQPKYGASNFLIQRVKGTNKVYVYINLFGSSVAYTGAMQDVTADIAHPMAIKVSALNLLVGAHFGINSLFIN